MDGVIGIQGKDFTLIAADSQQARSILLYKDDEDKITEIDSHKLMGCAGEAGDRVQFVEFIQKNIHLYELNAGIPLSTKACANFTRDELAYAIRRGPYACNILLGGWDKDVGPSLYYLDYMGSMHPVKFGAHGYVGHFVLSTMDRHYKPDMNEQEAIEMLKKCIHEVRTRFLIDLNKFIIKIVDENGIRRVEL